MFYEFPARLPLQHVAELSAARLDFISNCPNPIVFDPITPSPEKTVYPLVIQHSYRKLPFMMSFPIKKW